MGFSLPVDFMGAVRALVALCALGSLMALAIVNGALAAAGCLALLLLIFALGKQDIRAEQKRAAVELVDQAKRNLLKGGWRLRAAGCEDAAVAIALGHAPARFQPLPGDYPTPPPPPVVPARASAAKKVPTVPDAAGNEPAQELQLPHAAAKRIKRRLLKGKIRAAEGQAIQEAQIRRQRGRGA